MVEPRPSHLGHVVPPLLVLFVARDDDVVHSNAFAPPQLVAHFIDAPRDDGQRREALIQRTVAAAAPKVRVSCVYGDVLYNAIKS